MLQALFNFFYDIIHANLDYDNITFLSDILDSDFTINIGTQEVNYTLGTLLPFYLALISFIFIVILCCLFVYKIIKLVGNLIR